MTPIAELFLNLEGAWVFQRVISNGAKVEGVAFFSKRENDVLHYREEAELTTSENKKFRAYQEYIYCLQNEKIVVFFHEKPLRHFHALEFSFGSLETALGEHFCKKDRYFMTYLFEGVNKFTLLHRVKGEKKEYQMETVFTKSEEYTQLRF
jgi:hypothetical protein